MHLDKRYISNILCLLHAYKIPISMYPCGNYIHACIHAALHCDICLKYSYLLTPQFPINRKCVGTMCSYHINVGIIF